MPALRVSIDSTPIATVCTDGYDILQVRVHGTRIDEDLATLEVTGGNYPEQGESTYLTWINELPLTAGQIVTVAFLEDSPTSHPGKTIDELFRDEPPIAQADFQPFAKICEKLRAQPKLREKFSFRLASSSGNAFAGETTPDEHGFGFTVLWNWLHPERARVSLHSYTIESLEARTQGTYHFEDKIHYGESVQFSVN